MGLPSMFQFNWVLLSQRIYVALDEPDGVAGVAAVRTTEATLNEQILQYESTGNVKYVIVLVYCNDSNYWGSQL